MARSLFFFFKTAENFPSFAEAQPAFERARVPERFAQLKQHGSFISQHIPSQLATVLTN